MILLWIFLLPDSSPINHIKLWRSRIDCRCTNKFSGWGWRQCSSMWTVSALTFTPLMEYGRICEQRFLISSNSLHIADSYHSVTCKQVTYLHDYAALHAKIHGFKAAPDLELSANLGNKRIFTGGSLMYNTESRNISMTKAGMLSESLNFYPSHLLHSFICNPCNSIGWIKYQTRLSYLK